MLWHPPRADRRRWRSRSEPGFRSLGKSSRDWQASIHSMDRTAASSSPRSSPAVWRFFRHAVAGSLGPTRARRWHDPQSYSNGCAAAYLRRPTLIAASGFSRPFCSKFAANRENGGIFAFRCNHSGSQNKNMRTDFEFKSRGGGAWESNPPSTRKLAEQPF